MEAISTDAQKRFMQAKQKNKCRGKSETKQADLLTAVCRNYG